MAVNLQGLDLNREAKVQGLNLGLKAITGEFSTINRFNDYTELVLSEQQVLHGQKFFIDLLESEPGDVRFINTGDVFMPVIFKKYWPWAAGALVLGAILGGLLKR